MTSYELRKLADLIDQRAAIDAQINAAVSGITTAPENRSAVPIKINPPKRRSMSPEARHKISLAAKRRWKNAKIEGRNSLAS